MQSVKKELYIFYHWASIGLGALLLLLAILSWVSPNTIPFADLREISYLSGALAAGMIGFGLLGYNSVASKTTHWEAMLIALLIQAAAIFSFIQTTGRMDSPFIIVWGLLCLTGGMFGIYGSAGEAFISVMYFIAVSTDQAGNTEYTQKHFIILGVLLAVSVMSQFFWRRKYVDGETEKVATLSGELKTNQRQSEILVQSLTDGVLLVDNEGIITLMNPAAAVMTGWPVEDGTGSDCRLVVILKNEDGSDLAPTDDPLSSITSHPAADTKTLQLVNREGKQIVVSLVTSPVVNSKTNEFVGTIIVIRDISVSHQSDKQRAEFISTASHEMRTPVAAIEGYLQLSLNEKVSKIDPKARGYLEKALDSTHHLGQLFQDLLNSAKAEDGRLASHPIVIEMGEYIEQVAETFKFSAEKKGLLTDFIFGKGAEDSASQAGGKVVRPLYYVLADPDRLREVITNLFDNAVKYTPSGKISVGLTGNNDVVQLFVRDTGPGIPAEDVPHLFQKFYRVDNSATRTIGGTGLGLFICFKIIELYNGRIWVESEVGKGSTFYINLPRLNSQRAAELKSSEAQSTTSAPINSLTTPV